MNTIRIVLGSVVAAAALALVSCTTSTDSSGTRSGPQKSARDSTSAQAPTWSPPDMEFFLHGTMSTELVPETVLRAFIRAYPDLFPSEDLSHLGLIPDPTFGWPIGLSRRAVPHLGDLSAVGVNCAACHVADVTSATGGKTVRLLGATSHFDAEAFFGSVLVSTFRTADPASMKKFLTAYLSANDPAGGEKAQTAFARAWQAQEMEIAAAMKANPFGAAGIEPGALHTISAAELRLDGKRLESEADLLPLVRGLTKLFHNIRAAVHVPDQPPDQAPPASGPGRNDAFGLLSLTLLGKPQPYAPAKYGLVWNLENRRWVHWDGNTQSPLGRNLLASVGLGAPLLGKRGLLDFPMVKRQTDLTERIRAPRYPFATDKEAAQRGAAHYQARCASCHAGPESDQRLYLPAEIGTDPLRAGLTQAEADGFNAFLALLETPGYTPAREPGIRGTGKYWAPSLDGVWARSPYLHNGSVRTMQELLSPPAIRAKTFRRGSRLFDETHMGYTDEGAYTLDTAAPGNANTGHDYGSDLSAVQKRELIEFLKTL